MLGHPSLIPKVITELSCSAVLTHYSVQHKKKMLSPNYRLHYKNTKLEYLRQIEGIVC